MGKPFVVSCDTSGFQIGCVLSQDGRVVAYESQKLRKRELNCEVHDLEMLAVIHALKHWRHLLLGVKFELSSDNESLKYIFTQPLLNNCQKRWIQLLSEYDFEIKHVVGKENKVADALSCNLVCRAMSIVHASFNNEIKAQVQSNPFY